MGKTVLVAQTTSDAPQLYFPQFPHKTRPTLQFGQLTVEIILGHPEGRATMGNTTSFNNVTQIVETGGGLLLDASAFANSSSTHGPLSLTFDTVWVVDAGIAPLGPYEATSSVAFENLSGKWSGPEKGSEDDDTWWVTWSPEGGDDVKYTHVWWSEMSYGELDVFQQGFSASLKERLDSPGAIPLTEDPILGDALDGIEITLGI